MRQATLAPLDTRLSRMAPNPLVTAGAENTALATDSARDRSGFAVFAQGDLGRIHVLAHEAFDADEIARGHRALGDWLATHAGSGSDWVHLQFHMAVFELALGQWHAAFERFKTQILPAAQTTNAALTDAPALLWRLEIATPDHRDLPWNTLQPMAERTIDSTEDAFVVLHQLLVFAGARDSAAIAAWQARRHHRHSAGRDRVLATAAKALEHITRNEFSVAARLLRQVRPQLRLVGGSFAQNDLFGQLERWCTRHQRSPNQLRELRHAA